MQHKRRPHPHLPRLEALFHQPHNRRLHRHRHIEYAALTFSLRQQFEERQSEEPRRLALDRPQRTEDAGGAGAEDGGY